MVDRNSYYNVPRARRSNREQRKRLPAPPRRPGELIMFIGGEWRTFTSVAEVLALKAERWPGR